MAQPQDFGFGAEEQMVRDGARKFLKDRIPVEKLRTQVAGDHTEAYNATPQPAPWDETLWAEMVGLGWTALAVPEAAGGVGMGWMAVATLAEEVGRAAVPCPLIATFIATAVLKTAHDQGSANATAALEAIAGGEAMSAALTSSDASWEAGTSSVAAQAAGEGLRLSGKACFVQDARKVASFIVAANLDGASVLCRVPADAPGLTIHADRIVDLTRDQATLTFDNVEVEASAVVADASIGAAVVEAALPLVYVITAADIVGAAEWQMTTTAEYAKVRTQFDHPIGFFQAVKHPIVNMMVDTDRARSLVYNAACAADTEADQPARVAQLAHMAKASASDTAAFCSNRSVQLHGGIGFTWECDVHIWFKRQKHNQLMYGDGPWHRTQLASYY
jgi:alkylation response protein AidB-like acyl-CoA dehydrogenase